MGFVPSESDSTNTTGKRIRLQRRVRCLTQAQLADAVGVTQSAVARWEQDQAVPALRHRRLLAEVLEVAPAALFREYEAA